MSAEPDEPPDEEAQRNWKDRIALVAGAGAELLQTRIAIFREELSQKLMLLAKAAAALAIAVGLLAGVLLLFAAFLAALFTRLFGSAVWGIFATLALFAAGAAGAAFAGVKAFTRVRPTEFPASTQELRRDWSALRASWSVGSEPFPDAGPIPPSGPGAGGPRGSEDSLEGLEDRYRAGAE